MKRMTVLGTAATLLLLGVAIANAAPLPILLVSTSPEDDRAGKNFVFAVKDYLRGSSSFQLLTEQPDSAVFCLRIVTLKASEYSTAYSAVFTMSSPLLDWYLQQSVGQCGESRIDSAARNLVQTADEVAENMKLRK